MKRDYASNVEWMTAAALFGFVSGGEKIPIRPISEAFHVQSKDERITPHAEKGSEEIRSGLVELLTGILSNDGVIEDGTVFTGCEGKT